MDQDGAFLNRACCAFPYVHNAKGVFKSPAWNRTKSGF